MPAPVFVRLCALPVIPPEIVSVVPAVALTLAFCARTTGAVMVWLPRVTLISGVPAPSASVMTSGAPPVTE